MCFSARSTRSRSRRPAPTGRPRCFSARPSRSTTTFDARLAGPRRRLDDLLDGAVVARRHAETRRPPWPVPVNSTTPPLAACIWSTIASTCGERGRQPAEPDDGAGLGPRTPHLLGPQRSVVANRRAPMSRRSKRCARRGYLRVGRVGARREPDVHASSGARSSSGLTESDVHVEGNRLELAGRERCDVLRERRSSRCDSTTIVRRVGEHRRQLERGIDDRSQGCRTSRSSAFQGRSRRRSSRRVRPTSRAGRRSAPA